MKNSAIEQLIRAQHNIPEDVGVNVEFLARVGDTFEFKVDWVADNTVYTIDNLRVSCKGQSAKIGETPFVDGSGSLHNLKKTFQTDNEARQTYNEFVYDYDLGLGDEYDE